VIPEELLVGFAMQGTVSPDVDDGQLPVGDKSPDGGPDLFGVAGFLCKRSTEPLYPTAP
jgi:hypothetical protein